MLAAVTLQSIVLLLLSAACSGMSFHATGYDDGSNATLVRAALRSGTLDSVPMLVLTRANPTQLTPAWGRCNATRAVVLL